MCYVNRDRGLIFLAHPRTASTSIQRFLVKHGGFEIVGNDHHGRRNGLPGVAVAVIRDPYDVLVSWLFNRNWGVPFNIAFLERLRKDAEKYFSPLWFHLDETDHIIHFEDVERELAAFLGQPVALEHRSKSEKRKDQPYWSFYDTDTKAYVDEWLEHEIVFHGYEWPSHQAFGGG